MNCKEKGDPIVRMDIEVQIYFDKIAERNFSTLCGIDSMLSFQRDTQPTILVLHGFHIIDIYGMSVILSTDQARAPKLNVH